MLNASKCKDMMIAVSEGTANYKASEVAMYLASIHKHIMIKDSKQLIEVLIILSNSKKPSVITKTEFEFFVGDLVTVLTSDTKVSFSKYAYLGWLDYLKTGECERVSGTLENFQISDKIKDAPLRDNPELIHDLITKLGLKDTIALYSVMFMVLGL